jgi:folylpolyglutamate synthase/dihydropteroate synthase
VLLFGALDDKPWRAMLAILGPLARERVYCEPVVDIAGRRAVPARALADLFPGRASPDVEEALRLTLTARASKHSKHGGTVLVVGSIFLVGTVRAALLAEPRDALVPL